MTFCSLTRVRARGGVCSAAMMLEEILSVPEFNLLEVRMAEVRQCVVDAAMHVWRRVFHPASH